MYHTYTRNIYLIEHARFRFENFSSNNSQEMKERCVKIFEIAIHGVGMKNITNKEILSEKKKKNILFNIVTHM